MRLKTLVDKVHTSSIKHRRNILSLEDNSMGGVIQVGYDASKVKEHMPNAVNIDDKGFMSVNYIQVLVAKVASLDNLNNYKMAFNDLAANQMVAYNQASSGGFTLKSGQTNPNTLQMMTKDMAFAMYNLSPTTGSNDILGNQLMQKSLVSSFKYTISRKSCRK
jgi:hypothetical protein